MKGGRRGTCNFRGLESMATILGAGEQAGRGGTGEVASDSESGELMIGTDKGGRGRRGTGFWKLKARPQLHTYSNKATKTYLFKCLVLGWWNCLWTILIKPPPRCRLINNVFHQTGRVFCQCFLDCACFSLLFFFFC